MVRSARLYHGVLVPIHKPDKMLCSLFNGWFTRGLKFTLITTKKDTFMKVEQFVTTKAVRDTKFTPPDINQ